MRSFESNPSMRDILHDDKVKDNVQRMYEIGTKHYHESAFAVYDDPDDGEVVSDLLVPELQETEFEAAALEHSSVDMAPLLYRDLDEDDPDRPKIPDFLPDTEMFDYSHLDDMTRSRLEKILNSPKLNDKQKEDAVNRIVSSKYDEELGYYSFREDIALIAHNHPQSPHLQSSPRNLVRPSPTDMHTFERTKKYGITPTLVSAIVASDGTDHRMILIGSKAGMDQNPYGYEDAVEMHNYHPRKTLGSLALNGYKYTILEMTSDGATTNASLKDLDSFFQD